MSDPERPKPGSLTRLVNVVGVLNGFATIAVVVALGWCLARWRVLPREAPQVLGRLSFFVGSPALLVSLVATADLARVFAGTLAVSALAVLLTLLCWSLVARALHVTPGEAVIGGFTSAYVNAAYVGLPIATYVLHDASWIAPVLLMQVGFLQPLGLTLLDIITAREAKTRADWRRNLSLPVRNPMTLGVLAGLALNLGHLTLPPAVLAPLTLLGQLAVPTMLIAFGMTLVDQGRISRGPQSLAVWLSVALKMVVQPLFAYLAALAWNLTPTQTRVVVVIAALPAAQNIFVHALRYQRGLTLARDAIFVSTVAALPVVGLISLLLPGG